MVFRLVMDHINNTKSQNFYLKNKNHHTIFTITLIVFIMKKM